MNSEYAQSSSRENSIEQRKPMEELKRLNQSNSAPQPQSIQPIVIQCDLPQAMDKLTEQADGINWELEETTHRPDAGAEVAHGDAEIADGDEQVARGEQKKQQQE